MPDSTIPTSCPECGASIRDAAHATSHAATHWPATHRIPEGDILATYRAKLLRGEPIEEHLSDAADADHKKASFKDRHIRVATRGA